jgi:hypothetical protein
MPLANGSVIDEAAIDKQKNEPTFPRSVPRAGSA